VSFTVRPVLGIGEVHPGDDLAAIVVTAAPWLADGDVLVVTSKIVSKAEGQLIDLPADGPARDAAREAALRAETVRLVASRGDTRIVQTHHGFVLASAGIDVSNVERGRLALLPKDPDASARWLRSALRERYGLDVAVVITDTMGRPWRLGLVDVAIGAAGIAPSLDYRGTVDAYGNELELTEVALIDEVAAAAELVKGKHDRVPVAVVRGVSGLRADDGPGAAALVRPAAADLFSLGTAEARALGLRDAAALADATAFAPGDVSVPALPFPRVPDLASLRHLVPAHTAAAAVPHAPAGDPLAIARVGAQVHGLRAALAADGLASAWLRVEVPAGLVPLPAGDVPLGVLAIGRP
jgi:coenzyme F420-0:L-glutamate ligase / coenzyme F420-1:gamma-L-glutamate ligase